jgi:hypothetical protein
MDPISIGIGVVAVAGWFIRKTRRDAIDDKPHQAVRDAIKLEREEVRIREQKAKENLEAEAAAFKEIERQAFLFKVQRANELRLAEQAAIAASNAHIKYLKRQAYKRKWEATKRAAAREARRKAEQERVEAAIAKYRAEQEHIKVVIAEGKVIAADRDAANRRRYEGVPQLFWAYIRDEEWR